jgi:hypothetical protein
MLICCAAQINHEKCVVENAVVGLLGPGHPEHANLRDYIKNQLRGGRKLYDIEAEVRRHIDYGTLNGLLRSRFLFASEMAPGHSGGGRWIINDRPDPEMDEMFRRLRASRAGTNTTN